MYNSLRNNIASWERIGTPDYVLHWIQEGVPLIFDTKPKQFEFPNKTFNAKHSTFIDQEISRLLKSGCIKRSISKPHVVSPMKCVPKKGSPGEDLRLIVDLRYVNEHIICPTFSQEGIDTVCNNIVPGDYMITADFQKGFHHVPIVESCQPFLGIYHKGVYYVFTCLVFGLKCSPYYFYKVLRPVVEYLRSNDLRLVLYVDDCILLASEKHITDHSDLLLHTFEDLGWKINYAKSSLKPETNKRYLGFNITSIGPGGEPWITVPNDRIVILKKDILRALKCCSINVRKLARIAGQCVSMTKAILPAKLLLRNIYRVIATRQSWSSIVQLDTSSITDLEWWLAALKTWNGHYMVPKTITKQIVTDASSSGWGGVLDNMEASGLWNIRLAHKHSNYRELMAVLLCLKAFATDIKGEVVQILSDNITTVAYISHLGGPANDLSQLAQAVWAEALSLNVTLRAKHIAGVDNIHADYLSRIVSPYEWKLHTEVFNVIDNMWGPHSIDRFASMTSTQLPMYNSLYYDPLTNGVDALAQQDWGEHRNFVNPPFFLIPRVLQVIRHQKAEATLVAPWWPAQPWFRDLRKMSISDPLQLPNSPRVMTCLGAKPEPWKNSHWKIMVWHISGNIGSVT